MSNFTSWHTHPVTDHAPFYYNTNVEFYNHQDNWQILTDIDDSTNVIGKFDSEDPNKDHSTGCPILPLHIPILWLTTPLFITIQMLNSRIIKIIDKYWQILTIWQMLLANLIFKSLIKTMSLGVQFYLFRHPSCGWSRPLLYQYKCWIL